MSHQLIVMRHAKSDWYADFDSDFERPLNQRGVKSALKMGEWLNSNNIFPDLVIYSPAERAKQTKNLVIEGFKKHEFEQQENIVIYEAGFQGLLDILLHVDSSFQRVMIIGHNPGLEDLIHFLLGEKAIASDNGKILPTAAIAIIELPENGIHAGAGQLIHHVRP